MTALRKPSKYRNKPVWECPDCGLTANVEFPKGRFHCKSDILRFDSSKEYKRWHELKLLEKAGQIRNLRRQVPFTFVVHGPHSGIGHYLMAGKRKLTYVADFVYEEVSSEPANIRPRNRWNWHEVVEDCKGARTPVYKIKKELMRVVNGIDVRET